MKAPFILFVSILSLSSFLISVTVAHGKSPSTMMQGGHNWSAEEYSGTRTEKNLRAALASKGFAWLSGSPADNEKLSIGKNAQYFGFVALRYESGRAANRGALGRAFYSIANAEQRAHLPMAVLAEDGALKQWWTTRAKILRLYENHLYTGEAIDEAQALTLGIEFSKLGATVAIHEATAFAALEAALSDSQRAQLRAWRVNPEQTQKLDLKKRMHSETLTKDQLKQLEDLYAKAFSWITGTPEDNEIIPIGQPAQFFGFVSIRHKSGHAASRGNIAKSFLNILSQSQAAEIDAAIQEQMPIVRAFLEQRHLFLNQLALLRTEPDAFDHDLAMKLAGKMGALEVQAGWIEARAYRTIRETMTDEQSAQMMQLRGDYVLDEAQVEVLSHEERGEQLAILCIGCHGAPGNYFKGMIGPPLDGMFSRPIATADGFEFSDTLQKLNDGSPWTAENLDRFLAAPKTYAPGTKMEFQGLLNAEDRKALIQHLQQTRKLDKHRK